MWEIDISHVDIEKRFFLDYNDDDDNNDNNDNYDNNDNNDDNDDESYDDNDVDKVSSGWNVETCLFNWTRAARFPDWNGSKRKIGSYATYLVGSAHPTSDG